MLKFCVLIHHLQISQADFIYLLWEMLRVFISNAKNQILDFIRARLALYHRSASIAKRTILKGDIDMTH